MQFTQFSAPKHTAVHSRDSHNNMAPQEVPTLKSNLRNYTGEEQFTAYGSNSYHANTAYKGWQRKKTTVSIVKVLIIINIKHSAILLLVLKFQEGMKLNVSPNLGYYRIIRNVAADLHTHTYTQLNVIT